MTVETLVGTSVPQRSGDSRPADRELPDWLSFVARSGYAAKGLIYVVLGILSAAAAIDMFDDTVGTREAIQALGSHALGGPMLTLLAAGLTCYVAWRLIQVFLDPERRGRDKKALLQRSVLLLSGLAYVVLLLATVDMLLHSGTSSSENTRELWAGRVLAAPFGRWILAGIGVGVAIRGLTEVWKAYTARFARRFEWSVSDETKQWGIRLGRVGLVARGLIFLMVGTSLAYAGVTFDPSEVQGTQEALSALEGVPSGDWLAAIVAFGLAVYGVYQWFKAAFRHIPSADRV